MDEPVRGPEQRVAGRLMRPREEWQPASTVLRSTGWQPPIQGCCVDRRCCSRAPTTLPARRLKKAGLARPRTRSTASWRFDVAGRAPGSRILFQRPAAASLSAMTTSPRSVATSAVITNCHNFPPQQSGRQSPRSRRARKAPINQSARFRPIREYSISALPGRAIKEHSHTLGHGSVC